MEWLVTVKEWLITHLEVNNLMRDISKWIQNKRGYLTSLLDFFAQAIDTDDTNSYKAVDLVNLDFQRALFYYYY